MPSMSLPVGCFVKLEKPGLQALMDRLRELGYRVVGPTVQGAAIVLDEIESMADLPLGVIDDQEAGTYRLRKTEDGGYFDHVVGPQSLKNYLFPPSEVVLEAQLEGKRWSMHSPVDDGPAIAALGVRPCDLKALEIQDRIFLGDRYVNAEYEKRRRKLFVLAVNCRRAAATCFCTSMGTGPAAGAGFDLALTELADHFILEVATEVGGEVASATPWRPCSIQEVAEAQAVPRRTEEEMNRRRRPDDGQPSGRALDTEGIHDLLLDNLEHPCYDAVAERCLACGNCTMVCPTCFCSTVKEVTNLTGTAVKRERAWETCFSAEHSYMNSGTVHKSIRARYRQWLTHKLASWIDQFGSSGCTGCGRCITWCPVGIDLTEEVAAIRGGTP